MGQVESKKLSKVVDRVTSAGKDSDSVSIADILESVGSRGFRQLLLVPGLIVLSPISGIPGVPTAGAIMVFLIAGQMLLGRQHFWLPRFITRRSIARKRLDQASSFLKPISRVVDKVVWRRLSILTKKPFTYVIALTCMIIAGLMPPLEVILFANVATSAAICAFGLALVADDGLLALIAFAFTAIVFALALSILL